MTTDIPPEQQADGLPIELYLRIISHLERPELARVLRANSQLYLLACPLLYARLEIDPTRRNLDLSRTPSSGSSSSLESISEDANSFLSSSLESICPNLPKGFSYTTHLTLNSHHFEQCRGIDPLEMPSLRFLRIDPETSDRQSLTLCDCAHIDDGKPCGGAMSCCCPLISSLRPSQLLLGSPDTGLHEADFRLWPTAGAFVPEFVDYIAIIVGRHAGLDRWMYQSLDWIKGIPTTVKRLILVMYTADLDGEGQAAESVEVDSPDWTYTVDVPDNYHYDIGPKMMNSALAGALCAGSDQDVEVVGYESVYPDARDEEIVEKISEVRIAARQSLVADSWSEERAEERISSIEFIRGEDFSKRRAQPRGDDGRLREFREEVGRVVRGERRKEVWVGSS